MTSNLHPPLTALELDLAELSILILFRRQLDDFPVAQDGFDARDREALRQAKKRLLDRWDDQIRFKANQLQRKG